MPTRSVGGVTLSFEEKGSGPVLVLLHGFPLDCRIWDEQRAELSNRYRVITPDLRGFGKSASASGFSLEDLADDIHALLEAFGALPCALGGLSMGGYVALEYVRKYPADLRALLLIDTKAEADTTDGRAARDKMIELVRASGARAVSDQMMPKMLAPGEPDKRPALVDRLRTIMEACPPLTIEHALAAMRDRPDHTKELPSIPVPTLIIVGAHDAITPPATAEAMHRAIPRSQFQIIQGGGHLSPMEQPQQVNTAIDRFLDSLSGAETVA